MYYDAGFTPSTSANDGLKDYISTEKDRIIKKEEYVYGVLKPKCGESDEKEHNAWINKNYYTNIYNNSSYEQRGLEETLRELQEEKRIAIKMAVEKAEQEGKSQEEIDKIRTGIEASFAERIKHAQMDITSSLKTTLASRTTFDDAKSAYSEARYENISLGSRLYSAFMDLSRDWGDLGKLQQHQAFLDSQMPQGNGLDYMG